MFKEFKEFALKGSVIDMAVGIIIGVAFGTVIKSLVADILMPPIGMMLGRVDFSNLFVVLSQGKSAGPYATPALAKAAGAVTWNYGLFINNVISFLVVAFAVFIVIKQVNRLKKEAPAPDPSTKECPFCRSAIPIQASRCPHCTSQLAPAGG